MKLKSILAIGVIVLCYSVNSQCSVSIVPTDPNCYGDCDGVLTANPSGGVAPYSFQWYDDLGLPIGTNSNQLSNLCSGSYALEVTDANGCTPALATAILVDPQEIIFESIVKTDAGCVPDLCSGSVQAYAIGATKYSLNGVNDNTGNFQNLCSGNYELIAGNSTGCEISEQVVILPEDKPYAKFSNLNSEMVLPQNELVTFNNSTNATHFNWTIKGGNFDLTTSEFELDIDLPFVQENYEICMIAMNQSTCTDTACRYVDVRDEFTIWVPNSFTPNGDEFNNRFEPVISNVDDQAYDFFVFDRWGQLVFESHDYNQGWDGTFHGSYAPSGVYAWKVRLKSINTDERREYTGQLNLLK